jgi:glyoxylase-like metal-dependent hydrolase (beta-lactamase superfamily II)
MLNITAINTANLSIPAFETLSDEDLRAKGLEARSRIRIPVIVYAVETDFGSFLIDTGTDKRNSIADRLRYRPEVLPGLARYASGKTFGTVALTHADFDHCGNLELLAWKRFVVRSEEWQVLPARSKNIISRRTPPRLLKNEEFLEGRYPFLSAGLDDDGKFFAIDLPGHSPGHTGYILETDGARLLFAGDACESLASLDSPVAYAADDLEAYLETVEKLRQWRSSDPGLVVLPSHDPDVAKILENLGLSGS